MIDHIIIGPKDYKKYWNKFINQEKTEFGYIRRIESLSDNKGCKYIIYF